METTFPLLSKPFGNGIVKLEIARWHDGNTCFKVSASGGDFDDIHPDYPRDVNVAFRLFNHRSKGNFRPSADLWVYSVPPITLKDTLSAPVPGLRALLEEASPEHPAARDIKLLLEPWDATYDITAGDLAAFGLPAHGLLVRRETTSQGHDLALHITLHPAKDLRDTSRLALRLASFKELDGKPTEDNLEFFYDIELANRAFEMRLANDTSETTRLGMEGGTPRAHLEYRNAILGEDAISIPRGHADDILTHMMHAGLYDECEGLFYHLRDARDAIYSGNLVKWLGSVVVEPDGSSLYSKGRTKPFEMHIKVEVPPSEIDRLDDGTIDFALCYFSGLYSFEDWHEEGLEYRDLPYTDDGIENSVNEFLKTLGFDGHVNWSEHGRQTAGEADFDMDYGLIDQIWPEARPKTASSHVNP
jgi:hypothetical protein